MSTSSAATGAISAFFFCHEPDLREMLSIKPLKHSTTVLQLCIQTSISPIKTINITDYRLAFGCQSSQNKADGVCNLLPLQVRAEGTPSLTKAVRPSTLISAPILTSSGTCMYCSQNILRNFECPSARHIIAMNWACILSETLIRLRFNINTTILASATDPHLICPCLNATPA